MDTDRGNIAIQGPAFKKLAVTETVMPVFVRGGAILPTQRNQSTTYARFGQSSIYPLDFALFFLEEIGIDEFLCTMNI